MNKDVEKLLVTKNTDIKRAMKQLEITEKKILFVIDDQSQLVGSLTDGDIRRWILREGSLQDTVDEVCNKSPHFVDQKYSLEEVKKEMLGKNILCVPVVDKNQKVVELLFWESVFKGDGVRKPIQPLTIPVVIMAGGKGVRLDPFTKVLPKPLIPIGDKTVMEIIIEKFVEYGVKHFYVSVNYKSKIIKSYFEELRPSYSIEFINEEKPLGTGGGLRYLYEKIDGNSLLVSNCDIIVEVDYSELVDFHQKNNNDITMVASLKNYCIPYGICEIQNGGGLTKITEKPEYNFLVNTGMYVLRKEILKLIPENEVFHMTHLINEAKKNGGKIGVFPISENAWLDIGEWGEYKKALTKFSQAGE